MRFDYIFLNYLLYFFYLLEQMCNVQAIVVLLRSTINRAVKKMHCTFRKVSNRDNLIRADTFTGKRNYANARGTLRRWASTITSGAMFTNPYFIKIGEILKVVNRSAGFY